MLQKMLLGCFSLIVLAACTQESEKVIEGNSLPMKSISLTSLEGFRSEGDSWKVAGDVYANRNKDKHLEAKDGAGLLVNLPGSAEGNHAAIFTHMEHGDIDLSLDFLMPKNSHTGIYLQGRYGLQLLDSWGKDLLADEVCGSIYPGAGKKTAGKVPAQNAVKAPGLWQHLKIHFNAPRFDESGKKISDARLEEVYLNGVLVQQDVVLSGPTAGAAFEDEKPMGPLMIQGDLGPVAIRNIRYKAYGGEKLTLEDMHYRIYHGMYKVPKDTLSLLEPTKMGTTDTLSAKLSAEHDMLVVEGYMDMPYEGAYMFELKAGGPAWLYVDDKLVVENHGTRDYEEAFYGNRYFEPGKHPFKIIYANSDECLVLNYEGPGIPWTSLHTPASERHYRVFGTLLYHVKNEPVIQRGFMMHHEVKNPYVMSVGIPGGLNYAYELKNYNLLSVWHGDFLDVGQMWVSRGETQLEVPQGAITELSGKPAVALLPEKNAVWPDSVSADEGVLTDRGYKLMKSGLPVFFYTFKGVQVEDAIYPSEDQQRLNRQVNFHIDQPSGQLYFLLGRGTTIEKLPDGSYAVNDKSYYIDYIKAGGETPVVRQREGYEELLLPITSTGDTLILTYSIIW